MKWDLVLTLIFLVFVNKMKHNTHLLIFNALVFTILLNSRLLFLLCPPALLHNRVAVGMPGFPVKHVMQVTVLVSIVSVATSFLPAKIKHFKPNSIEKKTK